MTENNIFRFVIIGAGGIANHFAEAAAMMDGVETVSYTHLTLPTKA